MTEQSLEAQLAAVTAERDAAREQLGLAHGAMTADDERLWLAAERVGVGYFDCDTPEVMGDEIESLRTQLEVARQSRARLVAAVRELRIDIEENEFWADKISKRLQRYLQKAVDARRAAAAWKRAAKDYRYREKNCREELAYWQNETARGDAAQRSSAAWKRIAKIFRSKVRYYEEPGRIVMGTGGYMFVTARPGHRFTPQGICIRCGCDAGNWDDDCTEQIFEQAQNAKCSAAAWKRAAKKMRRYFRATDMDRRTIMRYNTELSMLYQKVKDENWNLRDIVAGCAAKGCPVCSRDVTALSAERRGEGGK